jgi:hypothetical protein
MCRLSGRHRAHCIDATASVNTLPSAHVTAGPPAPRRARAIGSGEEVRGKGLKCVSSLCWSKVASVDATLALAESGEYKRQEENSERGINGRTCRRLAAGGNRLCYESPNFILDAGRGAAPLSSTVASAACMMRVGDGSPLPPQGQAPGGDAFGSAVSAEAVAWADHDSPPAPTMGRPTHCIAIRQASLPS